MHKLQSPYSIIQIALIFLFMLISGFNKPFNLWQLSPQARAQQVVDTSQTMYRYEDHVGHHRHHIHHNPKHLTSQDATRFHTSRANSATLDLPIDEDSFSFVVFGDRTGGPDEGVAILADAVHQTNLIEPDLVMTVGDLIDGYNTTEAWLPQMQEYKDIMGHLRCPWFPTAGNHDIYWRGENKPEQEHETNYEMHFGPLWYAIEHRDCWFVVLYSDEPNPETGERNFNQPSSQRMSDEQWTWLNDTLTKAQDARQVFIFIHHPRWFTEKYGDDWHRVHQRLVDAGNVTAVFAGHIHHMRYAPQDGIAYYTLATVGGWQGGAVPDAGFTHQFHLVTVRQNQIAVSSIPVGELQDPKAITTQVSIESERLAETVPSIKPILQIDSQKIIDQQLTVEVSNPTSNPIDVTITPHSLDSRWSYTPNHVHTSLKPNQVKTIPFQIKRPAQTTDAYYRPLQILIDQDYLANGYRFNIPTVAIDVQTDQTK